MASASTLHHHYVSHDQTDNSYEGLEVDDTQRGLHVIPVPCGLESTSAELPRDDYDRPQTAVGREGGEPFYSADKEILTTKAESLADNRTAAKSKRQRWFLVWVFVIVAVVIAIAVPLALYGKKTHDDSTNTSTPRKFSISGAFNGTSIANLGLNGDLYTFYQDYLGQIRSLKASGQIYEAQDSPIILASGARNGTPLAAQYTFDTLNTILTAHLFYINSLDVLAEMVSNDNGSTWNAGSLDDFGFEASSSAVGLTALYVGDLSGSATSVTNSAIRLYYGSKDDDQVHEVICSVGSENWSVGFTFPSSNGNAGMASSPMDAQGNASLYLLDEHNQIRLWSHLLSTIVSSGDNGNVTTTFAPVGSWYQDPVAVPAPHSVFTNSSLCYSGSHLFYQEPSNAIAAIHPPGQTDETWSLYSSMGHQGIEPQPGSALAAAFENSEPNVFFQANGSDITQAWEDSVQWFAMGLPVG